MKISYRDLMQKLGVERQLHAYETQPWLTYDENQGITAEAEVRCNHDQTEIEAEIQFIFDKPDEGKPPFEQKCLITIEQSKRDAQLYTVVSTVIEAEEWQGKQLYDWETKSCNFFRVCVKDIKAGKIPDIEAIKKKEMKDSGMYGKGQGDGSNKSPKINSNQLLYDRKGIGAGF